MKIAVTGKGGVGKTLIAAILASYFAEKGLKTIAVDADPSPNLALTLGLSPETARKIVPISENKELVESKTDTGATGLYRLSFTVDDVVRDFSIQTPYNVNLIVMGTVKSMGSGCTCPANAVIRALLRHLIVERGEAVLLDMEAGVEHMGRGTARHVDAMLMVTDSSMKSLETAEQIRRLARNAGMQKTFLIGNKAANKLQEKAIVEFAERHNLDILALLPFDEQVVNAEMVGETPLKYNDSTAVQAARKLGEKILKVA